MSGLARIAKNASFLMASQIFRRVIGAVFVVYAARKLGVADFGRYALILTLLTFFSVLADGGLAVLTLREVSRDPDRARLYARNAPWLAVLFSLVAYALMITAGALLGYSSETILWMAAAGLALIPMAASGIFTALWNARQRMDIPALNAAGVSLLTCLSGIGLLHAGLGLMPLFLLIVLVNAAGALTLGLTVHKNFAPVAPDMDLAFCRDMARRALPYLALAFLAVVYFRVDTIMLSALRGAKDVGLYQASYKLIDALMFVPAGLMGALFPAMSLFSKTSPELFGRSFERALHVLAMLALPLAVGVTLFAPDIIAFLFGASFAPSAGVLRVLIWALAFMFLNAPMGNILFNSDRLKRFVPLAVGNTALNIALNFLLIPRFGFLGAGMVTLACEISGFFLQAHFVKRILGRFPAPGAWAFRPLLAALGMGVCLEGLAALGLPRLAVLATGPLWYAVFLLLLRGFDAEDRRILSRAWGRA